MEVLHDKALVNNVLYMFTFPIHVELVILLKYGMKRFPLNHLLSVSLIIQVSRFALNISGEIYYDTNIE